MNQQAEEIRVDLLLNSNEQGSMLNLSPPKMAIVITMAIFLAELCVMLLLDRLPTFSPLIEALVDSSFLIVFLVPAYIAFYRPFWKSRQQSRSEIRQLNHRLTEVTEEEKRRIALDLHDHCDQTLVALQKAVKSVHSRVIDSDDEAAVLCREVNELLGRLNSDIRSVSSALHPPQLEAHGLAAALAQHVSQIQAQNIGTSIVFLEKGDILPINKKKAIAIYRIAQEAIRNAIRHSNGKLIRTLLEYSSGSVALSVVDNGKGFNPKKTEHSGGVGLVGIRERANAHGGIVSIHSEAERGTSLRVSFKI